MSQHPSDNRLWSLVAADQQRITALDAVAVAIKGWVVTLSSALVGFAVSSNRRTLILVAIVAAAFFALLDLQYRTVQLAHAARSTEVELRMVAGFEFPRYRAYGAPGLVGRFLRSRYLVAITFYVALAVVLALAWLAFGRVG